MEAFGTPIAFATRWPEGSPSAFPRSRFLRGSDLSTGSRWFAPGSAFVSGPEIFVSILKLQRFAMELSQCASAQLSAISQNQ
jgi:hypothetical protein